MQNDQQQATNQPVNTTTTKTRQQSTPHHIRQRAEPLRQRTVSTIMQQAAILWIDGN